MEVVISARGSSACESFRWHDPDGVVDLEMRGDKMASKWISAALGKAKKRTRVNDEGDAFLFEKRPALRDFMTELAVEGGEVRELSVLMIAVAEDGLRVGLKDEAAGGWLWRSAGTVSAALDAIEKALQSGEARFTSAGQRSGKKAK